MLDTSNPGEVMGDWRRQGGLAKSFSRTGLSWSFHVLFSSLSQFLAQQLYLLLRSYSFSVQTADRAKSVLEIKHTFGRQ